MRLPYTPPVPPSSASPETQAAYTQTQARRSPNPLLDLDKTLLHAPAIASGWSSFFDAIRTQTSLPADTRELCICRIAVLNNAEYEWDQHVGLLRQAGVGETAVEMLRSRKAWMGWEVDGERKDEEGKLPGGMTEEQCAVLAYTDAMTVGIQVPDEIFERLRSKFDERAIVEITATAAGYNCVSRFLVALDVGEMREKEEQARMGGG